MRRDGSSFETWLLLGPALLVLAAITLYPLVRTLWTSFTDAQLGGGPASFVGLDNYLFALKDPGFRAALLRTLYFTLLSVGLEALIGVGTALLLQERFPGRTFVRVLVILPWAVPNIVNALMWRLILNPEFGSFNALLLQTGIIGQYRSWLGDPAIALSMVAIVDAWKNFPLVAFIVLAALQSVPTDLYEAARLDGAGPMARFLNVTLPHILPSLLVILALRAIEAFRVFDIVYVMTRGGPADATKTVSFLVYQQYFSFLDAGTGAAYAVVIALLSSILILAHLRAMRREGSH
ncbi:carbohydrate ABC transporter membrane protein 1, CUT1 family [Arboricoccus pini]|uniref:Carbohydrate ABC transporter membrane protein 1, CUT1 family n=1 Tax=Arboricoccus pini TaxID=1963835 RepID=A0A212RNB1_9PROT|nr:sugar ABC transporter permease [Arboricoccus pini]SNB74054.1 carbohydrate ABC transporter membrane protein 1, CUT1 family [Arboricoccus pini]